MAQFRTIEIDFDVHKCIEAERRSFDEPPNVALRRLLRLGAPAKPVTVSSAETGEPWKGDGVILPHGTALRMPYDRGTQKYKGRIENGKWHINGKNFESPSGAASELAVTKKGKATKLNGWNYWEVKRPGDSQWIPLRALRGQARKPAASSLDELLKGFT
jgi:hypothetical protein